MTKRRVVVTGLGMVTPLGLGVEDAWAAILAGKSGVSHAVCDHIEGNSSQICASVKNFDPTLHIQPKLARKMDKFIQYGVVAAKQAVVDANIAFDPEKSHRYGVAIGSGIGGLPGMEETFDTLLKQGPRRVSPMFIPSVIINMLAGHLSIEYGLAGPNIAVVTACTSGAHNIGLAARMIAYDESDVMLAGGSEMATCALGMTGFAAMRALSTRNDAPEKASRPWDRDRDGFVLGDGAGVVVLEEYEHAKARGAHIHAELIGFGMSADAFHMTQPNSRGAEMSMKQALADAKLQPADIDYINAHATSTPAGDLTELKAIKEVLGEQACHIPISSTKSMTGHLLGAAGAVEAIFSILAMRDHVAPPTINLDHPDEGTEGLNLVPHHAQNRTINIVMSNSFGFGGTNGTLIFKCL